MNNARRDRAAIVARALWQIIVRHLADDRELQTHIVNLLADEFTDVAQQAINDMRRDAD